MLNSANLTQHLANPNPDLNMTAITFKGVNCILELYSRVVFKNYSKIIQIIAFWSQLTISFNEHLKVLGHLIYSLFCSQHVLNASIQCKALVSVPSWKFQLTVFKGLPCYSYSHLSKWIIIDASCGGFIEWFVERTSMLSDQLLRSVFSDTLKVILSLWSHWELPSDRVTVISFQTDQLSKWSVSFDQVASKCGEFTESFFTPIAARSIRI